MKKLISLFTLACLAILVSAQEKSPVPLDAILSNYEYPYPVQYLELNIQKQQLKIAYMDVWPAQPNGHTIMLLHGKNFGGAYWGQTAKALSAQGFRVIIPDQIGFGKSSKPTGNIQYTFQMLAQNTKAILDTLRITKTSVLGHSMGGMLATRFTLMYPETVEKFILENPIGLEDWKLKVPYQSVEKWYQSELKQNYAAIKKYQVDNYYHGDWKPAYEPWANMLAGWTMHADYPLVAWNNALTYDMIFMQPVCYEFDSIKAPTLFIIGQADRTALGKANVPETVKKTMGNYPALGRLTQQKIKGSKLVEIEGVGHLPHIESFDQFINPLMAFLQEK